MQIKDWIQFISIIALIIGWFVNGYLNRRNEIAKKRLDVILPTLKSFSKIWYGFQQPLMNAEDIKKFENLLIEVREDFFLYGNKKESELYEDIIIYGTGKNQQLPKAIEAFDKLRSLIRNRIRKELNIKP